VTKEAPLAVNVELRDGSKVVIRPVFPDDKDLLREGFHRLSDESRYRRFRVPINELSESQLRYLTEIDHVNHMAWVALDTADQDEAALGVARYVRLADDPSAAEAAVVVADSYQGRGLGTLLLGLLGLSARENGINWFRAYVQEDNRTMLEILKDLGGTVSLEEPGLLRVDLSLPGDPEELPDTPTGRVFKAIAKQVLPPFPVEFRLLPLDRLSD
jgi:GNAT superfamily N-acetyltransferase